MREGGPPPGRTVAEEDRVVDPRWADRLNSLLVWSSPGIVEGSGYAASAAGVLIFS